MSACPGKLPPGAEVQLTRSLDSYRAAAARGVRLRVRILPGPGCPIAELVTMATYFVEDVPALPLPGCKRAPCCGCCYAPALE